ncbi:hypothetical protein BCR41DRAFT_370731 [Lobosporangium transversale]|uniref:Elongation factor 1 beta central acidic region eukaryote domain-containing protein n=1 Tax=Lobosporangium transversale TaxID=64571 RepID=A0A1Y2GSD0_9FUNG|nr:hypothetical protein BCR41DRAFT_370731 [Lobosporangium transversale]ORZ16153.1 hypothetical protein BCR41DRAFT_370731 [Lobosporangium transversale]|eukprot:XP_021881500.1 hypothetical protein BCR41DRAFT_370731 [Lobosporangium transversale]
MTYDPSHYKNNVEKLFNIAEKPLPFDQLIYRIDENEPKPKGKHLPTEVALASFLAKPKPTPITTNSNMDMAEKKKSAVQGRDIKTLSTDKTSGLQQSLDNVNIANDRAMMASVLAGLNMSPKALSLDDSDLDDNEDGGPYMESIDSSLLQETNIDDLFGDVVLDSPLTSKLSRAQRDSKPEDLFGEDEDEEETRTNQSPSDILEDNSKDEHDEDQDEEMESGEEEEDGVLDEDTIKTIAQLQSSSSTGIGGLFDSDDDNEHDRLSKGSPAIATKLAEESNNARLKALEAREAELEAVRERRQQLITSTLSNIDSREKKVGHVVFSDSGDDSYESEDYEKMEADHAKKMSNMGKPLKSIFNSDSGSEDEDRGQILTDKKKALKSTTKEMFASDDEDDDSGSNNLREPSLNIKEQFEGPSGRALFEMQTRIGTSDSRFQLTKDFLDDHIRGEDDVDFIAHQDRLNTGGIGADIEGIILDEDRQHESNVSAEKIQAMNVLRAMFGDAAVRNKKKEEDFARQAKGGLGYTTGLTVRYDPDADPSPPLSTLPSPPKTSTDSVHDFSRSVFDSESEEEQGEPQNYILDTNDSHHGQKQKEIESGNSMNSGTVEVQDAKQPKKAVGFSFAFDNDTLNHDNEVDNRSETSASPPPTNNKKDSEIKTQFQVATDLRSLFTPTSGTFTLFGNDHEEDEESHAQVENVEDDRMDGSLEEDRSRDQDEILTAYTDGSRTIFASGADALNSSGRTPLSHAGSLFFFHFKDPELLKRSNFKTNKVFMRTSSL